ncbi:hypothetical protein MP638_004434, partial [Amoeboaphelidium occidentale]
DVVCRGGFFELVKEEFVYSVLCELEANDLTRLSSVCKFLYAWVSLDEFWKRLVIKEYPNFVWHGTTWRETYIYNRLGKAVEDTKDFSRRVSCIGMFSDFLFQPWMSCSMEIKDEWLKVDNIARKSELSYEDFIEQYEKPNFPVILTDAAKKWGAIRKWSKEFLLKNYGDVRFRAEAIDTTLSNYLKYAENSKEESPFYLFDKYFVDNCKGISEDFDVPEYFREDLFKLLGEQKRPDYRWLIIGPKKSGSTFHKDPNGTSAWNATIIGSKKWILVPPDLVPPGVCPSQDESEVSTPTSIIEWFMYYYDELKRVGGKKVIECVTKPGELVFVPAGWWHIVINLDFSVAITQNYVSSSNLISVINFLKYRKNGISGVPCEEAETLGERFKEACKQAIPEILEQCQSEYNSKRKKNEHSQQVFWKDAVKDNGSNEGFSFSFALEE